MTDSNPSSPAEVLLQAKLMPPRLHATVIPRPELQRRLDGCLEHKLTLLVAPTGYGKTTLVNSWIIARQVHAAWLTLDEHDNDPARFWTYILTALHRLVPSLGKSALPMLSASQPLSRRPFLTALINDLASLDETGVLVLEDYQAITSPEIHEMLLFLVQHLPDRLHLVLITRQEPALPLGILRARDELLELEAADLRFDQAESDAFLSESVGPDLPPELLRRLQERTQGWVAGLRIASQWLREHNRSQAVRFVDDFSGSQRFIADYLIQEVFENQPQAVQDFLLKTCFLDRLTGALCDAVTGEGGGAALLERLGRQGLFLEALESGAGQAWYRYNPLFAESIQAHARRQMSDQEVSALFEKASEWYAARYRYEDAIEAALSAGSPQRAIALIEKYIEIHELAEMHTLGRWLERLPMPEILSHAEVCLTYAQIILYSAADRFAPGTAVRLEPFLQAAERLWREQGDLYSLGKVHAFRGIVVWWQGDIRKAYLYAHQSLQELPEHDSFWRGTSLLIISYEALNAGRVLQAQGAIIEARALLGAVQNIYGVLAAIQILSEVLYWQGDLDGAEALNQQIISQAVGDESMLDDQAIASLGLADIAYERNDLAQAEHYAGRALELTRQRGNEFFEMRAEVRLAAIDAARGEFQAALDRLSSRLPGIQNPVSLREFQAAQARLLILSGDLNTLVAWQTRVVGAPDTGFDLQKEGELFTLARVFIAQGKPSQALTLLGDQARLSSRDGRLRSQVTALCLEALAGYAAGDLPAALKALNEALTLGQAKEFQRLFLDEGPPLAALLHLILPTLTRRKLSLYVTTLLHMFNPDLVALQAGEAFVEPLSPQEVRVLRLLIAGLSYADIAREMVLSTNTVKTHVKSLYRKLNVRSRDEARQVARELRLA